MLFRCTPSHLHGTVAIPGSKSHTIRAVVLAALADGRSTINSPLVSADALSAVKAVGMFGASTDMQGNRWTVTGTGPRPEPSSDIIDVGNSGTTLRILTGVAALMPESRRPVKFTGDTQIQTRPAAPLLQSLNDLGAKATSTRNNGCPPYLIKGRLHGGTTTIRATSSQYLTSLLIACPLADGHTEINVPLLNERQYAGMTLWWLKQQGIIFEHDEEMTHFSIPGNQKYTPFEQRIPADFSSATFFFGAGALAGNDVTCTGLDIRDTQGDKAVLDYLRQMGAQVTINEEGIRISGQGLQGADIDMNDTPDALPVMAVLGCFAEGKTVLRNVAQARMKETDRIAVMTRELQKMGARIEEHEDGMTIYQSNLTGCPVQGHSDHRVVMALALAGLNVPGETIVDTAEAAGITFPDFAGLMTTLGGRIETEALSNDSSSKLSFQN